MNQEKILQLYRSASQLKSSGQMKEAQRLFKTIIRANDGNNQMAGAHFHLGEIAFQAQQIKKARNHFLQCLKINPAHGKAIEYIEKIPLTPKEENLLKALASTDFLIPAIERKLRDILSDKGFYFLKKHYYLPIPEAEDMTPEFFQRQSPLSGIEINEKKINQFIQEVLPLYLPQFSREIPSFSNGNPAQFFLINGNFMAVDAHMYYCMIRHFKPARIVEIGAGNSSLLAGTAIQHNLAQTGNKTEFTVIEPFPRPILVQGFPGLTQLIPQKVQQVPLDFFRSLKANDILFIDSSHVLKAGGDVQYEYLEILPILAPGVLVHIHDISLPKPYPPVYYENRIYWNEQYLLQAFLTYNSRFEILWPGNYMMLKFPEKVRALFPEFDLMRHHFPSSEPASFWMRVKP